MGSLPGSLADLDSTADLPTAAEQRRKPQRYSSHLSRPWGKESPRTRTVAVITEAELLRTPNFGRITLREVNEVLAEMGLRVGMNPLSQKD
jgi:hypothetical protein